MKKLNIHYDKKGDFLEVNVGRYTEGYFRNLGKGVFERVDSKTNKVTGIAIAGFRKRTEKKDIELSLPMKIELVS